MGFRSLFGIAAVLVLSFCITVQGQVTVGENLNVQGTASGAFGYGGSFGENETSSQSVTFSGSGNFNGFYFSPKLLSFHTQPYYNQSRANSNYETVNAASGVLSSSQFFAGSRFPGSISFDKTYNSLSSFSTGDTPLDSSGSAQGLTISWSALLPDMPTFNVAFGTGSSVGKVLGTDSDNTSHYRTLSMNSGYTFAGFNLSGIYMRNHLNGDTPGFYVGQEEFRTESANDRLGLHVTHALPMHGAFSMETSRAHSQNWFEDEGSGKQTVDTLSSSVSFNAFKRLSLACSTFYTDNLNESYRQSVASGSVEPLVNLGEGSHSLSLSGIAGYTIVSNLNATVGVSHLRQYYFNDEFDSTYVTGSLAGSYRKPVLGSLMWSVSGVDMANQEGNSGLGFASSLSFDRHIGHWEVSAGMDYDQNVQTMLATYTTSMMRWRVQSNRRLGERWRWAGGFTVAKSGITRESGDGNHSESFATSLSRGRWSTFANYSQSSGTSILTTSGLQPVTVVTPGLPVQSLVLFNGRSYGFGFSATPKRRMHLLANYSHATSATSSTETSSRDANSSLTTTLDYSLRAVSIGAGFSRYMQNVGATGGGRVTVNTYYFGISRWFKLF